jgi:hypothetical protein
MIATPHIPLFGGAWQGLRMNRFGFPIPALFQPTGYYWSAPLFFKQNFHPKVEYNFRYFAVYVLH